MGLSGRLDAQSDYFSTEGIFVNAKGIGGCNSFPMILLEGLHYGAFFDLFQC